MCGRYYMDIEAEESVYEFLNSLNESPLSTGEAASGGTSIGTTFSSEGIRPGTASNNSRDILPSDKALLITGREGLRAEQMRWGFPAAQPGKLLINARAETALHKPTFSDSVLRRRCVIPAAGFYEWDAARNKVTFTLPKAPCLFMAGFFRPYGDDIRFIILTTAANDSMRPVHDRMPLILPPEEISDWILAPDKTADYLMAASPELLSHREYEQMTLPFV